MDLRRDRVTGSWPVVQRFEHSLAGRFLHIFVELRTVDRALALASKLFIAILPLSILCTALVSGKDLGTEIIARFGLSGSGAHAARELFASPSQVQGGIGLLGILILVSSILSFARALERVYLDIWELPPAAAALRSRMIWLAGLLVYVVVLSPVKTGLNGVGAEHATRFVGAAGAAALFLWTPGILLGRRVSWRRLLPTAGVTGGAMLALGIGSAIVMPGVVSHNTERYGLIGFTFSIVSWLFATAVVVIAAAVLGKLLDEQLHGEAAGHPNRVMPSAPRGRTVV
jgi:uncharacterized BrkB/YihY/UPF0761 family membrane protein